MQSLRRKLHRQNARFRVERDDVAVMQPGDRAAIERLRRDMDRRRDFSGRPRHAPIGHKRHLMAARHDRGEHRRQLVQFRHADRPRALEANHRDEIGIEFARAVGGLEIFLRVKDPGRRADLPMFRRDRADLDHGAAEIAVEHLQAAIARKWL